MQRLYDFLRRHPTGVDTFWAVLLLGFGSLWVAVDAEGGITRIFAAIFTVGLCLVVALRRKLPVPMLLLTAAIGVGQLICGIPTMAADFAMFVITYTVASAPAVPRWASRCALAGPSCPGPVHRSWRVRVRVRHQHQVAPGDLRGKHVPGWCAGPAGPRNATNGSRRL